MKIKVLKATTYWPVVGAVHDVEASPRVRVLMHKGYIVKVEAPVVDIPAETVVTDTTAQAQAAEVTLMDGTHPPTDEDGIPILSGDNDDAPGDDIDEDDDLEDDVEGDEDDDE